jgi:trehalose synthase
VFGTVPTIRKFIADYRPIIGEERVEELKRLAKPLQGARVLHLNATAFGGGVAELMATIVPLMNDLGMRAEWQVIKGADEFFQVTKAMHNGLQGMYVPWTPAMRETWERYNRLNAGLFDEDYDFVVVHDPQPAGVLAYAEEKRERRGKWVWRCHIDLTEAQPELWDFVRPYVEGYEGAIFTRQSYAKKDLRSPQIRIMPPSIDPLSPKNMELPLEAAYSIVERYGVDPGRPIISQTSRFDPWKDTLGVIDVFRYARRHVMGLQLVLIASMAADDPEGWSYYERVVRHAENDPDVHVLTNLNGVGNVEVNAFQRASDVVIQKSIREGFGLVVSEALWKGRPVVGGNVGGIPLQVLNGRTGYLVSTIEQCTEKVLYLLEHSRVARRMGQEGKEHVRKSFLLTRNVGDYMHFFEALSEPRAVSSTSDCGEAAGG